MFPEGPLKNRSPSTPPPIRSAVPLGSTRAVGAKRSLRRSLLLDEVFIVPGAGGGAAGARGSEFRPSRSTPSLWPNSGGWAAGSVVKSGSLGSREKGWLSSLRSLLPGPGYEHGSSSEGSLRSCSSAELSGFS